MIRFAYALVLLMVLGVVSDMAMSVALPPAERDTIVMPEGTILQWHRAPALEIDLNMPIWANGLQLESGVYRLRDRKRRDLLRYAFARMTTTQPAEVVLAFYQRALGVDSVRQTDKDTGSVTLVAGDPDNCRLVTVAPHEGFNRILLQRVERFTLPPRVYTEREARVARIVEAVAATYRQAPQLAYTLEQQMETTDAEGRTHTAPILTWTVHFTRPHTLTAIAASGEHIGLRIDTRGDVLEVTRPGSDGVTRALGVALTSAQVPELQSDPVARLMLGDALLSDEVDYLALQAVEGVPSHHQGEVILTFPETRTTLRLLIDLQHQVILRSETLVDHHDQRGRVVRTYHYTVPEFTAPSSPQSPSNVPETMMER